MAQFIQTLRFKPEGGGSDSLSLELSIDIILPVAQWLSGWLSF